MVLRMSWLPALFHEIILHDNGSGGMLFEFGTVVIFFPFFAFLSFRLWCF